LFSFLASASCSPPFSPPPPRKNPLKTDLFTKVVFSYFLGTVFPEGWRRWLSSSYKYLLQQKSGLKGVYCNKKAVYCNKKAEKKHFATK